MKKFLYRAKNNRGQTVTGSVRAENEAEAEKLLVNHNFAVLDLASEETNSVISRLTKPKMSAKDKAVFARQLATMVSAGLELPRAIKVTSTQSRKESTRGILMEIYNDVEEGNSFSISLSRHPDSFDPVFVSIVKAGESTGKLDIVLKQLAEQLEGDNKFVGTVRGAMYYPAFILVALIGIGAYMMIKVIPQLKSVFDAMGGSLPIATKILMGLSAFIAAYWYILLICAVVLVIFLMVWTRSGAGAIFKNNLQLKTPGVKNLFQSLYMYRFSKVLSMLIGAGVPLLDALKIGNTTLNNYVYEQSMDRVIDQVQKGVPLSVQLAKDPIFPPLLGQMAAVGEETGQLDLVLSKVSDYYGEETKQAINTISTLVEPVILIIIGLAVAFLVFAVLIPIYNVAQLS